MTIDYPGVLARAPEIAERLQELSKLIQGMDSVAISNNVDLMGILQDKARLAQALLELLGYTFTIEYLGDEPEEDEEETHA
jgi:hypothetical protein